MPSKEPRPAPLPAFPNETAAAPAPDESSCCPPPDAAAGSKNGGIEAQFSAFMHAVNQPGALDVATKQAIAIALSVATRCGPCLRAQIKKAQQMGFSPQEIEEAAWLAVSFGGSPAKMFYNAIKAELEQKP